MRASMASEAAVRSSLGTVTKGTLLLLIATLGFIAENFVARVILIRALSSEQWTEFSLGLTLAGLFVAAAALGFPLAVARSLPYAHADAERRAIVRVSLVVVGISAFAGSVVLFLLAQPIGVALGVPQSGVTIQFFAVAVGFTILSGLLAAVFQGFEDVRPNAFFVQLLNPGLFIVFLGSAYLAGGRLLSYNQALVSYVLAAGLTLAVLSVYAWRQLPRHVPAGPTQLGVLQKLALFAAPLLAVAVFGYLTGSGDTLLLAVYNYPSVGTYTASLALARLLQVGIGALGYIFLPVATKFLRDGDKSSVRITYATATKWMVLASLPLFLLFFFLPAASLGFVYGPGYTSQTVPLEILVAGAFAATLVGPSTMAQIAFGQTRLLLYNSGVSAAVDLGLALALIPRYGIVGAAIAWGVANALQPILSMAELAVLEDVHPFRIHYLIPLLATGIPLGVLFAFAPASLSWWLLPLIGLAVAVVYAMVVALTGSIDQGDRLLLEAIEGMLGRRLGFLRRFGAWGLRRG